MPLNPNAPVWNPNLNANNLNQMLRNINAARAESMGNNLTQMLRNINKVRSNGKTRRNGKSRKNRKSRKRNN